VSADEQFHVDAVSTAYWRVTFDNGPVNLLDPDTVEQLGALIERIEKDPDLTVVVFRSEKPGYFMAHWDFLSDTARVLEMSPGPTGLHPYLDNFVRLSKLPVTTIATLAATGKDVRRFTIDVPGGAARRPAPPHRRGQLARPSIGCLARRAAGVDPGALAVGRRTTTCAHLWSASRWPRATSRWSSTRKPWWD
jgi:hypothetical protein